MRCSKRNNAQHMHFIVLLCDLVALIVLLRFTCMMLKTDESTSHDTNTHKHTRLSLYCLWSIQEVLVFVHNPFSLVLLLEIFSLSVSRYLMWSFDHNSIHIINLFSGRTICFFTLPIYFSSFFLLYFSIHTNKIRSHITLLHRFNLFAITSAH